MDTGKYLARIGLSEPVSVDLLGLDRLIRAHLTHVPFEALDVWGSGAVPSLEIPELYQKIVLDRRGGYCFELNGLLTHMFREMGFSVSERFARFLRGEQDIPMRRHRVTLVHMADGDYLCDIGVGQIAPRLPLKIEENTI